MRNEPELFITTATFLSMTTRWHGLHLVDNRPTAKELNVANKLDQTKLAIYTAQFLCPLSA